jgi:hypothetical protein
MLPVNETVKALSALAIALARYKSLMTEQMRESLTEAVHNTTMKVEPLPPIHHYERTVNADTASNSRRDHGASQFTN